jgi:hypothetical protein
MKKPPGEVALIVIISGISAFVLAGIISFLFAMLPFWPWFVVLWPVIWFWLQ